MKTFARVVSRLFLLTLVGFSAEVAACADGLSEGEKLYAAGQYESAEKTFIGVLSKEPKNLSAHYMLGNCLSQLGRANEAKGHYQYVIQAEPDGTVAEYCKMALQNAAFQKAAAGPSRNTSNGGHSGLSLMGPRNNSSGSFGFGGPGGGSAVPNVSNYGGAPAASPGVIVPLGPVRSAQFDDNSKFISQGQALAAECNEKMKEMDRDTAARVAKLQAECQDSMVSFSNGKYSYGAAASAYNQPTRREYDVKIKRENDANDKAKRDLQDGYAQRLRDLGAHIN